jgi:hypothetical protein
VKLLLASFLILIPFTVHAEYLGDLSTNKFDPNSITNPFSPNSVTNDEGQISGTVSFPYGFAYTPPLLKRPLLRDVLHGDLLPSTLPELLQGQEPLTAKRSPTDDCTAIILEALQRPLGMVSFEHAWNCHRAPS